MSARKISKDNDNESQKVRYLKHKIQELEALNSAYKEANEKLWKENDRLEKKLLIKRFLKWLKIKFHECETLPDDVLWGGDGTQYCSICGKQTQGRRIS